MDLRPFLEEDVGAGDVTTDAFVPDIRGRARITCEEDAVVAGLEEAAGIFALLGVSSSMLAADGDRVAAGAAVMALDGPLRGILTGERTALNFLMRMSGVATCTGRAVGLVRGADPPLMIAATRKTTPGFRFFEKKAVALGGGWPHRSGLHDMAMAKDNHILACGGLDAVLRRLPGVPGGVKVEVEVSSVEDGVRAAGAGADIVMADHMPPSETKELMEKAKAVNKDVLIEASGNITEENVADYAGCADIVSIGALTHSPRAVHFSLDVERP